MEHKVFFNWLHLLEIIQWVKTEKDEIDSMQGTKASFVILSSAPNVLSEPLADLLGESITRTTNAYGGGSAIFDEFYRLGVT